MAINYTLQIGNLGRKLSVDGLENVIYEVSVGVNAQSQEYPQFTYSCGGTVQFDVSEIDAESFVPFDQVTQETVVGWLLAKEGIESVDEFSYVKSSVDNIQARIDALQVEDSVNVGWAISNVAVAPTPVEPQVIEPPVVEEVVTEEVVTEEVPAEETITE